MFSVRQRTTASQSVRSIGYVSACSSVRTRSVATSVGRRSAVCCARSPPRRLQCTRTRATDNKQGDHNESEKTTHEKSSTNDGDNRDSGGGKHKDSNGSGAGGDRDDGQQEDSGAPANRSGSASFFYYLLERLKKFLSMVTDYLQTLPTQAVVAITGVVTTLLNLRYQRKSSERKQEQEKEQKKIDEEKKKQEESAQMFKTFSEPLLKSAAKLQDYLFILCSENSENREIRQNDALFMAYLFSRYFCFVELLKHESTVLDFGRPASDRLFANILGRIQVVMDIDDKSLTAMYGHLSDVCGAVHVKVPTYVQSGIGELLQRKRWKNKQFQTGLIDAEDSNDAGLNFPEFVELYETNSVVAKWLRPLVQEFDTALRNKKKLQQPSRQLSLLQGALVDLVEFLDPPPECQIVPAYRRNRLAMPGGIYDTPMPDGLRKLYWESARMRAGKPANVKLQDSHIVDVFVMAAEGGGSAVNNKSENIIGDCPFSHRVVLALEAMHVPYNLVCIDRKAKPYWYHIIHPDGRVPVLAHQDVLIEDSANIIEYAERELAHRKLAQRLRNTADPQPTIANVHSSLIKFTEKGDQKSKAAMLDSLHDLDITLSKYINEERGPFFGGQRLTIEDVTLMPFLYHMLTVPQDVRHFTIPMAPYPHVEKYRDAMQKCSIFDKSKASRAHVSLGYRDVAKGRRPQQLRTASDILD